MSIGRPYPSPPPAVVPPGLTPQQGALLAAIRLWFGAGAAPAIGALAPMRDQLRRGRVADAALLPLFSFLGVLDGQGRRRLDIRPPGSLVLAADEQTLLRVLADRRPGRDERAGTQLASWLPLIAWQAAVDSAAMVAAALAADDQPVSARFRSLETGRERAAGRDQAGRNARDRPISVTGRT